MTEMQLQALIEKVESGGYEAMVDVAVSYIELAQECRKSGEDIKACEYKSAADEWTRKAILARLESLHGKETIKNLIEESKQGNLEAIMKLADWGYGAAQFDLGRRYFKGNGVEINIRKAMELWEKAALNGESSGYQYMAGTHYYGDGDYEKDFAKAVECYVLGAYSDNAQAQADLAYCLYLGEGVSENKPLAVFWYGRATLKGNPEAQFKLGMCYIYGEVVDENAEIGLNLIQKAMESGHQEAGEIYRQLTE
jgi:TPR repeat protein